MSNDDSEKIYNGLEAIVVAMDIGTTQSAVSFAYLSPGSQPQLKMVDRWPSQAHWNGAAKIPSMVSYSDGVVKACGAEAMPDFEKHQENVAYQFKLHLHPASLSFNSSEFQGPPLPAGITIEQVYGDLMKYLMEKTQRFFETTTANGVETWARLRDTIVIVLATPNEWDIREQSILRKAAIQASLVAGKNAGQLLRFVTEAEASVHYALANYPDEWLGKKTVFAVVDCGGSTVDTTVYRCVSTSPLRLEEACPSECIQAGGIFVNREFRKMLESKLKGSAFGDPDIINSMTDAFEKELKPKFDGMQDQYELKFGVIGDKDLSLGIDRGRITLSNEDLKLVFDAVTDKICSCCSEVLPSQNAEVSQYTQLIHSLNVVEYVLLVGGFGDSPYVQKVLSERLGSHRMQIITVEDYGRKAAAGGATIGHIKQLVVARAARATFGGCVRPRYDRRLHRERKHTKKVYPDGKTRVDGAFHVWIKKGAVLHGTFAHKLPYHVAWDATSTSNSELSVKLGAIEIEVFAWEREGIPKWCKDEQGTVLNGMRLICTLNADLSALAGALEKQAGRHGKSFYRVDYNVYVYFGGTQLRANLQWHEKGVLREGPVKVMPITEERSNEKLGTLDEDGPREAVMANDNPPTSGVTCPLSELPATDISYSPDATILPPPAATLRGPSREALISTVSSSALSRPTLISTPKHTEMSEVKAPNSSPGLLHGKNQSLGPDSPLGVHAFVGSTTQARSFYSNSALVSSAQKAGAEEIVELRNPNNSTPFSEGDGMSETLEKLMIDYVPRDLSGQVTIPDVRNPAQGGLADVYLGWFDKKEVAVKVLRMRKSIWTEAEWVVSNERRIRREMHVWCALKHRNISEFLGYSTDLSDYPAMISTWYRHGTAYDFLNSQMLSVRERIRLALDVSEGLCYLHDLKIIHGDLKPNNVLVDDTCVARLCDFGLVRLVDWEGPSGMNTTSPYTGTPRYKAPELFFSQDNRHPVATFEGDMYSLGCVMMEFIERLYPFKRFAGVDLRNAIMDRQPPALRSETTWPLFDMTDLFWDLLETCWGGPSRRPSIKEVIKILQSFTHAMSPTS